MNWNDFNTAFQDAKQTLRVADENAEYMADILVGRLRKCSGWTLAKLKRELKDFNPQRRTWKR